VSAAACCTSATVAFRRAPGTVSSADQMQAEAEHARSNAVTRLLSNASHELR